MIVLDLYCGAGGAAAGYQQHGARLIGVDITNQPRYPGEFWHLDAIRFMRHLLDGGIWHHPQHGALVLDDIALIHASPPCQLYTAGNRAHHDNPHPDLVDTTRQLLIESRLPYVIENVPGAPLHNPIELCGRMFGLGATESDGTWLQLDRHRLFETSFPFRAPTTCRPHDRTVQVGGVYGGARRDRWSARNVRHGGYVPAELNTLQQLLGIDWMTEKELYLAIPPAYTSYIYQQWEKTCA